MKVAHLVCVSRPYYSGISNAALQLATASASFGFDTDIITPQYDKSLAAEENYGQVNIRRLLPLIKSGNAAFIPGLIKELKQYDIVHLHFPFFGGHELVWLVKNILGYNFKLVLQYHMNVGELPFGKKIFRLPTKIIFPGLLKSAAKIICSSLDYLQHNLAVDHLRKYENKIIELPFGIDTQKFLPDSKQAFDPNRLLFVGALDSAHSFKGLGLLLDTMTRLDEKITLTIVGGGDLESAYRQQAKKNNISSRVIFAGRLDDKSLISQYRSSSLLVLPSINNHEAFGIVLLEALACGLPVIASNLPGVRTVFEDNSQGLLAKPGDINDLKKAIETIINNPGLRTEMSCRARQLAEKKYSLPVISRQLKSIYDSLL